MKNRALWGMRGKKGVSAMPIRRPGTAGSAVAAMAGGQGLRSSRPGHLEAKKNEINRKGEIWVLGEAHSGELGVGDGSGKAGHGGRRSSVLRRASVAASEA